MADVAYWSARGVDNELGGDEEITGTERTVLLYPVILCLLYS